LRDGADSRIEWLLLCWIATWDRRGQPQKRFYRKAVDCRALDATSPTRPKPTVCGTRFEPGLANSENGHSAASPAFCAERIVFQHPK
jgi:hypothetical protein